MKFEDIHNHASLTVEIVKRDVYKLRSIMPQLHPDVVFDIGANIGVFTHYAHERFPDATIVAVEPHPENFAILKRFAPEGVFAHNLAIGHGAITRYPDVQDQPGGITGGESYISDGFGYEVPDLEGHAVESTSISSAMLSHIRKFHAYGQRYMVKIDCEGAENIIFAHPPSVEVLRKADFVAMELHPYWATGTARTDKAIAHEAAMIFSGTHRWDSEPPYFYAWRKPDDEPICSRSEFGQLLRDRNLLGNAAEIGVATGNYSRDILNWGVKYLRSVDLWADSPVSRCGIDDEKHEANYQEAVLKLRTCDDWETRSNILRMTSVDAAKLVPDGSLDFCYIDALHKYDETMGIYQDLRLWWPKVRSGGILAGHDYLTPSLGVNRAVTEFAAELGLRVHLVIEHQGDASFWIKKP